MSVYPSHFCWLGYSFSAKPFNSWWLHISVILSYSIKRHGCGYDSPKDLWNLAILWVDNFWVVEYWRSRSFDKKSEPCYRDGMIPMIPQHRGQHPCSLLFTTKRLVVVVKVYVSLRWSQTSIHPFLWGSNQLIYGTVNLTIKDLRTQCTILGENKPSKTTSFGNPTWQWTFSHLWWMIILSAHPYLYSHHFVWIFFTFTKLKPHSLRNQTTNLGFYCYLDPQSTHNEWKR